MEGRVDRGTGEDGLSRVRPHQWTNGTHWLYNSEKYRIMSRNEFDLVLRSFTLTFLYLNDFGYKTNR